MTFQRLASTTVLLALTLSAQAQRAHFLRQHDMGRWGIPAGNYSGIAHIAGNRYALVSDKQAADGWHEVAIDFDANGDVCSMAYVGAHYTQQHTGTTARDAEGIVAVTSPGAEGKSVYTLFVSAESDQEILEMDSTGTATGRRLQVPEWCGSKAIFGNYGFEALAYDAARKEFWTTTEQGLRADVGKRSSADNPHPTLLRLLCFDDSLQLAGCYAYRTEAPQMKGPTRLYAFGVPEMTAINDTTLLVLEREVVVKPRYNGSYVHHQLFSVQPHLYNTCAQETPLREQPAEVFLPKRLVGSFTTRLQMSGHKDLANYEGMCLGPTLPDGRQTLLLVADSQNRMGNRLFRLKDYIRVAILNP